MHTLFARMIRAYDIHVTHKTATTLEPTARDFMMRICLQYIYYASSKMGTVGGGKSKRKEECETRGGIVA